MVAGGFVYPWSYSLTPEPAPESLACGHFSDRPALEGAGLSLRSPLRGSSEAPSRLTSRNGGRDGASSARRASLHKPGGFSPGRAGKGWQVSALGNDAASLETRKDWPRRPTWGTLTNASPLQTPWQRGNFSPGAKNSLLRPYPNGPFSVIEGESCKGRTPASGRSRGSRAHRIPVAW